MPKGGIRPSCSLKGCERPHEACGYCTLHYSRFKRNGDPNALQQEQHGMTNTKVYKTWDSMKERCYGTYRADFKHYGGRGIRVCDRWKNSFIAFYEDMGEPPSPKHSLDRIDHNGNYEPSNCRWATQKEQQNNKRNNLVIEFKGIKKTLTQWSELIGIPKDTLSRRLKSGWSIEKALTTPLRVMKNNRKALFVSATKLRNL